MACCDGGVRDLPDDGFPTAGQCFGDDGEFVHFLHRESEPALEIRIEVRLQREINWHVQ